MPCIAHVVVDGNLMHYVVIHKITKKQIVIADPGKGIVKLAPIEKFCVGGIIYSHIFLWNKNLFLVIMVHVFHNLFVVYLTESYLEGVDCGGK
ncbi:MAG: hypothetical protein IKL51_03645 [Lachnospiraceae bacterium]|nr:hypothetical protein [Lachnospiraceae bacterium]